VVVVGEASPRCSRIFPSWSVVVSLSMALLLCSVNTTRMLQLCEQYMPLLSRRWPGFSSSPSTGGVYPFPFPLHIWPWPGFHLWLSESRRRIIRCSNWHILPPFSNRFPIRIRQAKASIFQLFRYRFGFSFSISTSRNMSLWGVIRSRSKFPFFWLMLMPRRLLLFAMRSSPLLFSSLWNPVDLDTFS